MIKAVIFDFFDVIRTDTYKIWLKADGFARVGIFHEVSNRLDAGKITVDEFLETLGKQSGKPLTLEQFDANAKVDYSVLSIIKSLRKNYRIAILSNTSSALFREILRKNDLEKYFDEIVVSSEIGHIKPYPEIFEHTLEKLGINASETIFIDDNEHNIKVAERVGIKGIHFVDAQQLKKELKNLGIQVAG